MEAYPAIEFEAVIENGVIKIPTALQGTLAQGTSVIVRVTEGSLSRSLRSRGVQESEIEEIAGLQMEPRENVVRFLEHEGALSKNRLFVQRAQAVLG